MKKKLLIALLSILTLSFYSFIFLEYTITSILKEIDFTEERAKGYIWSNINYSNFNYPAPKALKKTTDQDRGAIIKVVGNFVKAYTQTDDFMKKYKENLLSRKPIAPEKPDLMADMRAKQKEDFKKSITEMEANKKKMAADQQAAFDGAIKIVKEQLTRLDDPANSANDETTNNYLKMQYEDQMNEYKAKLAEWEKEYNASPNLIVKKWLQKFLDETKDIDYNAELKTERGSKRFVNEAYEGKSNIWKLCFRVGKPATEAARGFAKSWSDEINR